MDRNSPSPRGYRSPMPSLSARRAWIEIANTAAILDFFPVALRKESVDRNSCCGAAVIAFLSVALRKESVDRNGG